MATQKVKVRIEADGKQATREIKRTQNAFTNLGSSLKKGLILGAAAAAAGLFALVKVMKSAVTAANVQEDAIRKLDAATAKMGAGAAAASLALQAQAAALQQVTKFGDETIISGQALIASFTDSEQKIKDGTVAALNLAAATGTELKAAFLLMGRAAAGETSTLSRYGITLEEGLSKNEAFAAAVKKINEQFGGQAQAAAQTFTGKIAQLSNAYGDLLEKLGEAITENEAITKALTKLKDLLTSGGLVDGIENLAVGMSNFVDTTVNAAVSIKGFLSGLRELDNALLELNRGFEATNDVTEDNKNIIDASIAGYKTFVDLIIAFGDLRAKNNQIDEQNLKNQESLNQRYQDGIAPLAALIGFTDDLGSARQNSTAATNALADAEVRRQRIDKETAAALKSVVEIAKELGVTLSSELVVAQKKAADAMDIVRQAYDDGLIKLQDYDNIVKATKDDLAELEAELTGVKVVTDAGAESVTSYGQAAEFASVQTRGLTRSIQQQTGALIQNNTQARASALGTSTIGQRASSINTGITLSGGTFTTVRRIAQTLPDGSVVFT